MLFGCLHLKGKSNFLWLHVLPCALRLHQQSLALGKRPILFYLWSLAGRILLHERSLAE